MMPYALGETISKSPIEGGIEISNQQYAEAFTAKLAGREALVLDGDLVVRDPAPSPQHTWEDGEWVEPEAPEPEPVNPLTLQLTKRQVNTALILSGITDPDGFIEGAISTIFDTTQRALSLNDWRYAPYYERSHPLFNDPSMLSATGMAEQQIDTLWQLATQQPT